MNFDIYLYFSFMYYYLYFSFKVRIIECMTKGCRMCFFFCFILSEVLQKNVLIMKYSCHRSILFDFITLPLV